MNNLFQTSPWEFLNNVGVVYCNEIMITLNQANVLIPMEALDKIIILKKRTIKYNFIIAAFGLVLCGMYFFTTLFHKNFILIVAILSILVSLFLKRYKYKISLYALGDYSYFEIPLHLKDDAKDFVRHINRKIKEAS
jgi:hypothetical protein